MVRFVNSLCNADKDLEDKLLPDENILYLHWDRGVDNNLSLECVISIGGPFDWEIWNALLRLYYVT